MLPPCLARFRHALRHCALLLTISSAAAVEPVDFTWTDAVAGNWSDATKWTDEVASGSVPATAGLAGYTLEFSVAGTYAVTQDLDAGFQLSRLRLAESELTVDGNGIQFVADGATAPEIQQEGVAPVLINVPVILGANLNFGGSGTGSVTLAGGVSGNGGLLKSGSGLLALTGNAAYSGNTAVNAGILRLSQANAANDSSSLTIAAGAALELDFVGNDTVLALVLDGVTQPDGIYNASNSGGAITGTGAIRVFTPPPPVPSSNANLAGLSVSGAALSPAFNSATGAYAASVSNPVTTVTVTPTAAGVGATIRVNGNLVASGTPSIALPLNVGHTLISTIVTAENGVTSKTYSVAVNRGAPVTVASAAALVLDPSHAKLNGSVDPNGVVTAYFEYGPTPAYGSRTPGRDISGVGSRDFEEGLSGLQGATTYYFRAVAESGGVKLYGNGLNFTTPPQAPFAATGQPSVITASTATFVGTVNPGGVKASAYFEYGLTTAYGNATPVQNIPAGNTAVGVQAANVPLIANAIYHCRLVASNAAGTASGNDVIFSVSAGGGSGVPLAAPAVVTVGEEGVTAKSAVLRGTANPNQGTTLVRFEYGTSTLYGKLTPWQGVGNGNTAVEVARVLDGLLQGTTYHYRLIGANNLGTSTGADEEFTTAFPAPTAVTEAATVLTSKSVRLNGTILAHGNTAEAWIEYGTDPNNLNLREDATPKAILADANTAVALELGNLVEGITYHYRVGATGSDGQVGVGETRSFDVSELSGLIQQFPPGVAEEDRDGSVTITLSPPDIGSGWRFAGERSWRASGVAATGLTSGDRIVEYRPVPGYLRPANETVAVASGGAPVALTRTYTPTADPATGSLTVFLKPQDLTELPEAERARWKFFGEGEADWKESGATVDGLAAGSYVILCKEVNDRSTPLPVTATVADGENTSITITYFVKEDAIGTQPAMLAFEAVSTDNSLPNAYVGQLRGDAGSGSGFVVRPRVVVTAGHVIFDDGTLAATTGLRWLFQQDRDVHSPVPQTPRGSFLMTGYAAQRAADNSPGISTPASQNLDAGTLFFFEDAGRGGFSGYMATDTITNGFLLSGAFKTFAGYPIDGTPEADLDRMHATPPSDQVDFTQSFERTYVTSDIRGSGGASGGPLCVLNENGSYYPAAIYLGGTNQTVVRALDREVVEMIQAAERSSEVGEGATGGSVAEPVLEEYEEPTLGALKVIIEPAEARDAGAGWKLASESSYRPSGEQLDDLPPDILNIAFSTVDGFVSPSSQVVTVTAASLTTITFTYESVSDPPEISSPGAVAGTKGQELNYQIVADHSPFIYTLFGLLPAGLELDPLTGLISGTLQEAGDFSVTIGAGNSGGTGYRQLQITSLPVLADQAFTAPYQALMSFQPLSSEGGVGGVTWSASGLPQGVSIHPATGLLMGVPPVAEVYPAIVSVTNRGAQDTATITLTITGIPPEITQQPAPARSIKYGTSTALTVAATGLPEPAYQWYEGLSGDTSLPVQGATSPVFITPPLTGSTSFWARASSISGHADSNASAITILPSSNANLIGIVTSKGPVTPFNAAVTSYTFNVPNEEPAIQITPLVEVAQSTVKVKNVLVPTNAASAPIPLNVGANTILIDVTSGDGSSTKRYTLTVVRAQPPSVTTGIATSVAHTSATLNGSANSSGVAGTVFFQYGPTTAYGNATPGVEISGSAVQPIAVPVTGLSATTPCHFRIGITTAAGTIFGIDKTFTTTASPPYVATGQASDVEATKVRLIGAVVPNGTPTTVYFEWGETTEYGQTTPEVIVPGGTTVVDITRVLEGLVANTAYHYRLVGKVGNLRVYGNDVIFIPSQAGGGSGTPDAVPEATTGDALSVTNTTATLLGSANPMGGTTFAHFEYGLTTAYGNSTSVSGIGNGTTSTEVVKAIGGLSPGKTYHYRLVAKNSLGAGHGEDHIFQTGFVNPSATTGDASPVSPTVISLSGKVNSRGAPAEAYFEYGTDGSSFPVRVQATPGSVNADGDKSVQVELDVSSLNPNPGVTYYYRAVTKRPTEPGGTETFFQGLPKSFRVEALLGQIQSFPRELDLTERQGQVQVDLLPEGMGSWRFVGEIKWRASGSIATGLTTGEREIEFLPVSGYHQPGSEIVGVISGQARPPLVREYLVSATPPNSTLQVNLLPAERTGPSVPQSSRLQWRLFGYENEVWHESGDLITGLMPGSYLVECKAALDLDAPAPLTLVIGAGEARVADVTYNPDLDVNAGTLRVLPYDTVSTRRNLPYAYVGQIRNDTGSHSGFAVKRRVVATTAQAVFDEIELKQTPGLQWLFQNDRDVHEPKPQVPRGFYAFDDYAAQRKAANTPGTLSHAVQELNAAALYFTEDAGRGGFSGFMATDGIEKPLGIAGSVKTLVGYPVRGGGSSSNHGRMEASRSLIDAYTEVDDHPSDGIPAKLFGTTKIMGLSGMLGGPLCIQTAGGNYLPAGIYLGGSNTQNLVRAIDSDVIDLFNRAALTANTGENHTNGGISQTSYTAVSAGTAKGALTVIILPVEAQLAGARWKLNGDSSFLVSGTRKNNMSPGAYTLLLKPVAGFQTILDQTTTVQANNLTTVTVTYLPELSPLFTWRASHFGITENTGNAADGADPDGDGSLNLDEYVAGTDPMDPSDVFRVTSCGRQGQAFSVVVPVKAGRIYTLQRRTDLESQDWSDVVTGGPVLVNGTLTLTDPAATAEAGFYQVKVESLVP